MSDKRLYRSSVNYMLAGVCGGIGEYFNIDPTLIRLAWVIVTCMSFGSGIIAYIQNKKKAGSGSAILHMQA